MLHGPGENAGVVDIGDGLAAVFKIESHNHPSFIAPKQGAATGVGGILRDVFTMGARPVANLDSLRLGPLDQSLHQYLLAGVVDGIGSYGNAVGVATVGGETQFHACYAGNILVNAFNLGIIETDKIFLARASGVGNPVMYVGSKTGRDGIHGASLLASAEFDAESEAKLPTVQVGDPFTEKCLIEACLELMADGCGGRHPGHGRRGPHVFVVRDGQPLGYGDRAGPRRGPAARDRHDPLRVAALRESGAHAAGRPVRGARKRSPRSSGAGISMSLWSDA